MNQEKLGPIPVRAGRSRGQSKLFATNQQGMLNESTGYVRKAISNQ